MIARITKLVNEREGEDIVKLENFSFVTINQAKMKYKRTSNPSERKTNLTTSARNAPQAH